MSQPLPIDLGNNHLVGSNGQSVTVALPPRLPMTPDEAITLAAWLVLCALDTDASRFRQIFEAVCSA